MTAPELRLIPLLSLALMAGPHNTALGADSQPPDPEQPPAVTDDTWIDVGRHQIITGADNIAEWMNDFFGDVRTEEDAPFSTLRLRYEQEWDEANQFDSDIKLRGKVYLPQLNKRLSLLFDDEDTGETGRDDLLIDERDTAENVTLQYRAKEEERYSIDYRVGIRSSLNLKGSVRYKYEYPLAETLIGTFSQEALYLGGDGFASKTRFELDKILSEDKLLQFHNKIDWEENESGIIWSSSLSLDRRLSEKKAFGYFVGVLGRTHPESYVDTYSVGVRYRQNFYRPWLFGEVQPSYRWYKEHPDFDREGAAVIFFRLEAVFQKDLSR